MSVTENVEIYSLKMEMFYHQTLLNNALKNDSYDTAFREAEIVSKLCYLISYLNNN